MYKRAFVLMLIACSILFFPSCRKDKTLPPQALWAARPPEYILPESSTIRLTPADIATLNCGELELARMEILARHGYVFDEPDLRGYFVCQPWYNEKEGAAEELTEVELQNHALITARQEELALRMQPIEMVNGAGVAYVGGAKLLAGLRTGGGNNTAEFGGAAFTFSTRELRPAGTIFIFTIEKTTFVALPSLDRHSTLILQYGSKKLTKAGLLPAHPEDISVMENGTLLVREYGGWLHDWKRSAAYTIKKGKLIKEAAQQGCMWAPVALRQPLTVQATPGDPATEWTLPAGAEPNLLWCTDNGWVMLEAVMQGEHKTGWFLMRDAEILQDGRPGVSVFEGLSLVN